jgi:predicted Zn-dependent protease
VKVAIIVLGDAPPGLARSVLRGLPDPWARDRIERSDENMAALLDRTRLELVPHDDTGRFWLGLAAVDLMLSPLAYVCGIAPLGSKRGLVSWARLGEGLPSDSLTFPERVIKEAAHELGHAAGLIHCAIHNCVMHASVRPDEMDLKRKTYCPSCMETLLQKLG